MTPEVDQERILQQLSRITASDAFTAGVRVRKFLQHVVTEELEGRGDQIKGTVLAMDLFGRDADFDPGSDPIVRTEAVKLRKALEHFYLTEGVDDEVVISVPKGTYRPTFEIRAATALQAPVTLAPGLPILTIRPFTGPESPSARLYRDGLPGEIALELARFGHIRVRTVSEGESAQRLPAGYLLNGQVQEAGSTLRLVLQLERYPSGEVIWSERHRISVDEPDVFALQEEIARACATRMADAYGALGEHSTSRLSGRGTEDAGVFEALLAFHAHMRTSRFDSLKEFSELAELALRDNPDSGLAHALIVMAKIEAVALGQSQMTELVSVARKHAEQAVALAPNCQEALFAAAVLSLVQDDRQRFETLLAKAVDANPNGALLTAMAGAWISMAGDLDRGTDLVRLALERNPMLPLWTKVPLALGEIGKGNHDAASRLVAGLNVRDVAAEWIVIAAAHGLAGNDLEAKRAMRQLEQMGIDVPFYLASLPLETDLAGKLLAGVEAASRI